MTVKCPTTGMGCTSHCPDSYFCENQRNTVQEPRPEQRRIQVPDPWGVTPRKDYVYTILWSYTDNSDYGVVDVAFRKKEDAEDMLKLLDEHSESRRFVLCQSVLKS